MLLVIHGSMLMVASGQLDTLTQGYSMNHMYMQAGNGFITCVNTQKV